MPKLPDVEVCTFKSAPLGALVSALGPKGETVLGLRAFWRAEKEDPGVPVFVAMRRQENGNITAAAIPTRPAHGLQQWVVNGSSMVVNHSADWAIHVRAEDWSPRYTYCTFADKESGLLLLDQDGNFGLAAINGTDAQYLCLSNWEISGTNTENYVSARKWNISQPGIGQSRNWPLGGP